MTSNVYSYTYIQYNNNVIKYIFIYFINLYGWCKTWMLHQINWFYRYHTQLAENILFYVGIVKMFHCWISFYLMKIYIYTSSIIILLVFVVREKRNKRLIWNRSRIILLWKIRFMKWKVLYDKSELISRYTYKYLLMSCSTFLNNLILK